MRRLLDNLTLPGGLFNAAAGMIVKNGILGHIVLNVADLKESERFYRSVLGLNVSARNRKTKMTFLSYGKEHHDIALQALPKGEKHVTGPGLPKLHHFCIYVDSDDIIDKIYPILKRRKIPIVSGPETLVVAGNRSISFLDPDGNRVEIACNRNKFEFDSRKVRGTKRKTNQDISRKGAK
jgi:catechol-2,3-dioxygenase